jgi:hypothetical protein
MPARTYKETPGGAQRGKCTRCTKILALNVKGKLRIHQDGNHYCYGSKQLPVA